MQSHYYRLDKNLDANKLLHDIKSMISSHAKVNKIEDAILHIEIKDVAYTYDQVSPRRLNDGRKEEVREPTQDDS